MVVDATVDSGLLRCGAAAGPDRLSAGVIGDVQAGAGGEVSRLGPVALVDLTFAVGSLDAVSTTRIP
jgi:hypothetical protein